MTLEFLRKVLPVPAQPVETGNKEKWRTIERVMGTILPQDYKDYINTYGSGQIGKFLWVTNPFSKNSWLTLQKHTELALDALRSIRAEWGDAECPYALFPETNGLLPWGFTDNGDTLFWLTSGNPEQWSVVINESRGPQFELHSVSMSIFLANLITGEMKSEIIPYDFIDRTDLFMPRN